MLKYFLAFVIVVVAMMFLRRMDECPTGCDCSERKSYTECRNQTAIPEFPSRMEITDFVITDSSISIVYPNNFAYYPDLLHLRMTHCNISYFRTPDIWDLVTLIRLDISFNNLTDISSGTFSNCPDLLELNLTHNPLVDLKSLRPVLISESLMYLSMKNCQLTKFSKLSFSKLPNLVYLDVSENKLITLGGVPIRNILPKLVMLGLANNNDWNCRNLILHLTNCSSIQPSMRCTNEDGSSQIYKCKSTAPIKLDYWGIKRRYSAIWYKYFDRLEAFYIKKYKTDAKLYKEKYKRPINS